MSWKSYSYRWADIFLALAVVAAMWPPVVGAAPPPRPVPPGEKRAGAASREAEGLVLRRKVVIRPTAGRPPAWRASTGGRRCGRALPPDDMIITFEDFARFCNITMIPPITGRLI